MAVLNFPDPTSQTPANTFSPTSTPNATSNGVTYVWTNGSWSIAGVSNGGFLDKDEADSYYVEQSGDNMTGDLTLGTDKITLGVDGSAEFAGEVIAGSANIGDGSNVLGAVLNPFGLIKAQRPGLNSVIQVFQQGSTTPKAEIKADGSAEFAGVVESVGKPNSLDSSDYGWGLYQGPASEGFGALWLKCDDRANEANAYALSIRSEDGSDIAHIKYDGSARFDSGITLGHQGTNVPTAVINSDGSATFAGFVKANGLASDLYMQSKEPGSGGAILCSGGFAFRGYQSSGGNDFATPTYGITYAGTASFRGISIDLEPDNDANYVTTTDAEGNESRVYNGPTLDVKERLQTKTAALEAIKTAAQDASITTLADFKAAIATALANI